MKITFVKYMFLALITFSFSACYKDLGNYDYTEPNKVSISGINEKYTVMQGSYFEVIPELTFTEANASDSARYTYEWIAMKKGALVADKRKDLGTGKSLRTNIAIPSGSYNVYYRVKDTVTGLQFQKVFDIDVVSSIYEGWLAMTEVNGKARLDMVSKVNNEFIVIKDVLNYVGSSLTLKGKPVAVNSFRMNPLADGYGIFLSTNETTDRVEPETFQYKNTYNIKYEMIANVPDDFAATEVADAGGYRSYMISGTNAYFYYYVLSIRFGLPINIIKDEPATFEIAPYMAINSGAVFYDNTNKRFVRHIGTESTCSVMPEGTLFDFNTGMDLVYMTYSSFSNGNVFAILHSEATGKYMLARFTFGSAIQQVYYEEMTATEMAMAKNFAVSPGFGYIFYTVGGKLYSYDMSLKASKLMLDKGANEFTALKFRGNTLVAASFDAQKSEGENGILEEYTVMPVQGDLQLLNRFSGLGKIISFSYRTR